MNEYRPGISPPHTWSRSQPRALRLGGPLARFFWGPRVFGFGVVERSGDGAGHSRVVKPSLKWTDSTVRVIRLSDSLALCSVVPHRTRCALDRRRCRCGWGRGGWRRRRTGLAIDCTAILRTLFNWIPVTLIAIVLPIVPSIDRSE